MKPHHEAWLSAHPDRSLEWLREKIADGFHVHHVDGNHGNNAPSNLILIDGTDHMRLHGMRLPDGADLRNRVARTRRKRPHRVAAIIPPEDLGRQIYMDSLAKERPYISGARYGVSRETAESLVKLYLSTIFNKQPPAG